ncbi:DUF4185 domain-containing protein [Rhodococcus triatomae]|nr:DUF4185 domain-containing protein [Rhodococcus triatomae]QNG21593.1 DUF4185 domain-containing protein [Rhodococcus triatomae]QNG25668.1 DUF4185 domain-containing protein [Rhodococcus triatomae]
MSTAQAAPTGWLPVNSCGETGLNPARPPAPDPVPGLPLPPLPDAIQIPLPYPEFVPVPEPGPAPDLTRVEQQLPDDPCANPCPDLTDRSEEPDEAGDTGSSGSHGSSGSSGSADLGLPRIEIVPQPETIPIPVPSDNPAPEPQPAPPFLLPPIEPAGTVAAPPTPDVRDVRLVSQLTGPGSENRTDKRWQVSGTDLGIIWESAPGEVAVAFGDTFGLDWRPPGANGEDWRSNVLGHSTDTDLSDGMTIDSMVQGSRCHAAEILDSRHVRNYETTTIPTSGFAIGDRQYMSYMSVRRWSVVPGMWYTNHGGIAYSDDNGQTWTKDQHAKWHNIFGLGRFQVAAMVPQGDHVYVFGTPNGRMGSVGLARVPTADVLNPSAYQYWVAGHWVPVVEHLATPVVDGTASELSVRYDAERDVWQMAYLDLGAGAIVLREATTPQGAWSERARLVETYDYPSSYGGFLHPWSTPDDLYFTLSHWDTYNVYLMHAEIG